MFTSFFRPACNVIQNIVYLKIVEFAEVVIEGIQLQPLMKGYMEREQFTFILVLLPTLQPILT